MPKRSIRDLRRKLREFSDTLKVVQLIAQDSNVKLVEIFDVDVKDVRVNIKDLSTPGTSKFWIDDIEYIRSLVQITKKPEPKPKPSKPKTDVQPLTRTQDPPIPDPPKPQIEGGVWCYYCKTHRMPDPNGKCIECGSRLIYDWIKS